MQATQKMQPKEDGYNDQNVDYIALYKLYIIILVILS